MTTTLKTVDEAADTLLELQQTYFKAVQTPDAFASILNMVSKEVDSIQADREEMETWCFTLKQLVEETRDHVDKLAAQNKRIIRMLNMHTQQIRELAQK
jgi:hypothetical protein